ncbi:hypothetical protein HPP92_021207 [Vanilla planifolia]|uniref:Uncharacterized protein n=1 Tax=Vanilla planifolia TaxID=51239 RepID=A0A835PV66_VANPL|nr:hypothetical protein HPP92_021207 [Vanilla planifolia]
MGVPSSSIVATKDMPPLKEKAREEFKASDFDPSSSSVDGCSDAYWNFTFPFFEPLSDPL